MSMLIRKDRIARTGLTQNPLVARSFRTLAITALTVAVVLFLAEQVARALVPPQKMASSDWFVIDPNVGYKLPPNRTWTDADLWGTMVPMPWSSNARGFRLSRPYPAPRQENEIRVLAVGDSTTGGMFFEIWPEFTGKLLDRSLPDHTVWLQNSGLSGYSSLNTRKVAEQEVPAFKPDIVAVCVGANDAGMANRPDSADFEVQDFGRLLARVGQHSRLITGLRDVFPENVVRPWVNVAGSAVDKNDTPRVSVEQTAENIRGIIEVARRHGAEPVVALHPWLYWRPMDNNWPTMADYGPYLETIQRVCQEENVAIVNLVELFDRPDRVWYYTQMDEKKDGQPAPRMDNYHFNQAGADYSSAEWVRVILPILQRRIPGLRIDETPLREAFARHAETPHRTDFRLLIPDDAFAIQETARMNEKNTINTPEFVRQLLLDAHPDAMWPPFPAAPDHPRGAPSPDAP